MDVSGGMTNQIPEAGALGAMGILLGLGFLWLIVFLVIYVYNGITLMMIANKTKTENSWWAWIPILNLVLLFNIAKKPWWWLFLILVPLVNLIIIIVTWMEIAKARGKPDWVGILLIVPIIGPFIPAYLAFSE